jgi:hypothetical protein
MQKIASYKIYELVVGDYDNGFRFLLGKVYKNAGKVVKIEFDLNAYTETNTVIFHIIVENESGEQKYWQSFVNQKYCLKYDTTI